MGNGRNRIRYYSKQYNIDGCPLKTELFYAWLVIENASEADAGLAFTCRGGFTASNPEEHNVIRSANHSLVPSESVK